MDPCTVVNAAVLKVCFICNYILAENTFPQLAGRIPGLQLSGLLQLNKIAAVQASDRACPAVWRATHNKSPTELLLPVPWYSLNPHLSIFSYFARHS
jgi:hypothetical protein